MTCGSGACRHLSSLPVNGATGVIAAHCRRLWLLSLDCLPGEFQTIFTTVFDMAMRDLNYCPQFGQGLIPSFTYRIREGVVNTSFERLFAPVLASWHLDGAASDEVALFEPHMDGSTNDVCFSVLV